MSLFLKSSASSARKKKNEGPLTQYSGLADLQASSSPPQTIICTVIVTYSYSPVTFSTKLQSRIIDEDHISLNDLVNEINKQVSLESFQISFLEENSNNYVFCGTYPLPYEVGCYFNKVSKTTLVKIRLRQIFNRDNMLRMEFVEEENDNAEEPVQQNEENDGTKNKRAKERKIGYIIKKVYMWRKMYCGFIDEKGRHVKLNLEEAADKIGISKKSLDDYLIQLRMGKMLGFNFNDHKNDKVGVLRTFIKRNKWTLRRDKSKKE